MHFVGRLDKTLYRCVTVDLATDEVVITDERIEHIKARHPGDYEQFAGWFREIVEKPDYILEANKPNSAVILKEIQQDGKVFKTVLRLATSGDRPGYKNSIITFLRIDKKDWERLIRNKVVLYKRE